MANQQQIEFKVGRRSVDGLVRISAHPPELVQLSVSYKGERASTVVLTRSQVQAVREALAQLEANLAEETPAAEVWNSDERRSATSFSEKLTA